MATPSKGNRYRFTADQTFYVDGVSGNNNNNGIEPGKPKADIQQMIDDLKYNYDGGGFQATIQVADYNNYGPINLNGWQFGFGAGPPLQIIGNVVNSENCVINGGSTNAVGASGAFFRLAGFKIITDLAGSGSLFRLYDNSVVYHNNLWLAGAGHEGVETHDGCSFTAEGLTRISGTYSSIFHFTDIAQQIWEDQTINLVTSDGVTLGTTSTGPKGLNYIFGGNRASSSFARATFNGSFGCDATYQSRIFMHIDALLNVSSTIGLDAIFPGQTAPQIETGGSMVYEQGVGDIIYCRLDALGNNGDGYANTANRAFLTFTSAAAYLAKRPPDQIFAAIPTIQIGPGTWPAFRLVDIPGVAEVILLGDESTLTNVVVSTTGANCFETLGTQTKWHIRGFSGNSVSGGVIVADTRAPVAFQNIAFGVCGGSGQIIQTLGSSVESTGPYIVNGNAPSFINNGGGLTQITHTGTFTGALTYSVATVVGRRAANMRWTGTKTIGTSVTGTRVDLADGAFLDSNNSTSQAGIPGSADGPVDAGSFAHMI